MAPDTIALEACPQWLWEERSALGRWSCFKAMELPLNNLGEPEISKQAAFLDTVAKKG
jgi:hypothetical protein